MASTEAAFDSLTYTKRFLVSLLCVFAYCFTTMFFAPIEIVAYNSDSLSFELYDVLLSISLVTIVSCIVITALISLFKGKIFVHFINILFGLTICCYFQENFLNRNLGLLTGDRIDWEKQKLNMLSGLLIWIILLTIPFIIYNHNKRIWKKMIRFISNMLIIMQFVAFTVICVQNLGTTNESENLYLTTEDMYTFSSQNNIIVFLIDRLDYDYIESILQDSPDFFDKLDGFTSYTNAISEHARTEPAENYILNNYEKDIFQIPKDDYFDNSWSYNGRNILQDLTTSNFKIDIYSWINTMFGNGKRTAAYEYVDNISTQVNKLNICKVIQDLLNLSAYRYMPVALKPFFWCYTDNINKNAYLESNQYHVDEVLFSQEISTINKNSQYKYFKFYHFNGSHEPYNLNEDGTKSTKITSVEAQTKGCFQILYDMFYKMKELNIYKDATIIITADHGAPVDDYQPLQKATRIGLFYKPSGNEGSSLKFSQAPVSLKNIPPTILKGAGIAYSNYGQALDEVGENEDIVRTFYKAVMEGDAERYLYLYEITGDAADFSNWKNVDVLPIKYGFH